MFNTSVIEISRSALKQNIEFVRNQIGENVRFCSVVKGNAYGHGIEAYVPLAESYGVNYFGVFSSDEALRVFQIKNTDADIVVMGMIEGGELRWAVENGIEFFVFDIERLNDAISFSKEIGKKAKIHIEVETGMNRTGWSWSERKNLVKTLNDNTDYIGLYGLCTHFAGAESLSNMPRVKEQFTVFEKWKSYFQKENFTFRYIHTACSAAMLRFPEAHGNMVRVGILQYGLWPNGETFVEFMAKNPDAENLPKRLITWKSTIMQLKHVPANEYVGYGNSYYTPKDTIIGVVPVGYGHGFSRSLSNLGRVLVNGCRVSVIGLVNMNALIINLNDVPNVKKGDEVILIGKQGDMDVSIGSFSDLSHQLNYESITRLDQAIPRQIIE